MCLHVYEKLLLPLIKGYQKLTAQGNEMSNRFYQQNIVNYLLRLIGELYLFL